MWSRMTPVVRMLLHRLVFIDGPSNAPNPAAHPGFSQKTLRFTQSHSILIPGFFQSPQAYGRKEHIRQPYAQPSDFDFVGANQRLKREVKDPVGNNKAY